MSFVVHTEELNLVSATAEGEPDAAGAEVGGLRPDLRSVVHLAIPTIVIQLSGTLPSFLTASYVGRNYDVAHLDGFTLATLTGNLFTLSILTGLYSASDTLSPQAYGAGNSQEVGYLAIRGFVSSMVVTIPAILLLGCTMDRVLVFVGEDEEASLHAWTWYKVYIVSLPFYALFQCTMKFLMAQNCMKPLVVCVLVSCFVVLPISLFLFGGMFGFVGTALANVVFQAFVALSLIAYLWYWKPHNVDTWVGLKQGWEPALQRKPLLAYMALGAGGMLASSEWIYWEVLSLIIGTFGVVPLSVHTIPTQVITVSFMLPLGIGIALSVRLGATLPVSVPRAKQMVLDCTIMCVGMFGGIAALMFFGRYTIYSWFTNSEAVIAGCDEIWWKVVMYANQLSLFGVLMGCCIGLGMQWILGITTIVVLWVVGLPVAYFMSVVQGGGLNAAWSAVWPPYVVINLVLLIAIIRANWDQIAEDIRIREGMELLQGFGDAVEQPFVDRYGSTRNGERARIS